MPVLRSAHLLLALLPFSATGALAQAPAAPPLPDKGQFQAVENAWSSAVTKRDQYALENVLSSNLVDISATGDATTRNGQISRLFAPGAEPLSLTQTVITVRSFGPVAVVNGTYVMKWPGVTGGESIAEKGIFTHVFERNGAGAWQCVNSQRTVVADQAESTKRERKNGAPGKGGAPLPTRAAPVYKAPQPPNAPGTPGSPGTP